MSRRIRGKDFYIHPRMERNLGVKLLPVFIFLIAMGLRAQDTAAVAEELLSPAAAATLNTAALDSFCRNNGIDISREDCPELYAEVFRWYHTCYRYGGSGDKGIDCSGFVNMLYEKVYGKKIPRASYLIYEKCKPLSKKEEMQEGDFVFFKIRKKRISHVGIYLQKNKFAHATTQSGVIISDLDETYYRKYFFKAGRLE